MLKAGIEELAYLPERPSAADVQAHLEKLKQEPPLIQLA